MKYELGERQIKAIEKAVNAPGSPKVEVCIKQGRIEIFQINSKRVQVENK